MTSAQESALRGVPEEEIIRERTRWLQGDRRAAWAIRKWRALNAVHIQTYCRLNGSAPGQVRRALCNGECSGILEPITGRIAIPIWMPLAEGFSYDEIERARRGEQIFLMRLLLSDREVRA